MSRLDDWKGDQSVLPCRGPAIDQSHVSEVKEWREEDGRGPDRFWRCSLTIDVGHEVESCCCGLSPSAARGQRIPWPEFIILFVMNYLVEGLFAHGKYFTCLLRRLPQQRQSGTVHHHHHHHHQTNPRSPRRRFTPRRSYTIKWILASEFTMLLFYYLLYFYCLTIYFRVNKSMSEYVWDIREISVEDISGWSCTNVFEQVWGVN